MPPPLDLAADARSRGALIIAFKAEPHRDQSTGLFLEEKENIVPRENHFSIS